MAVCPREGVEHTWFGSMMSNDLASLPQALLLAPLGPGLAAFNLAWRILLSKELPLEIQIRPLSVE